jgi:hypothetical protein
MGLKTSDIVLGYEKAQAAAQQTLEGAFKILEATNALLTT